MTVRSVAATRPVRYGLRAAMVADAAMAALVAQRVYNGEAPRDALRPYVVLRNPAQSDWGTMGEPGASGVWYFDAWADTADLAERIMGAAVEAVGGVVLEVEGFGHVSGVVDVLDVGRDPASSTPLYHGVGAYRWTALGNREG